MKASLPSGRLSAAGLVLLFAGLVGTALLASASVRRPRSRVAPTVAKFKATPARLARGRYLVETVSGCFDCHSEHEYVHGQWKVKKGMLGAGNVFPPNFSAFPPGARIVPPNITPDKQTGIGSWTDAEIARAIRDGVAKNGRPLFALMPYWQYHVLTTEDVKSIVVFLRSIPPVHHVLPLTRLPFPVRVDMNRAIIPPLSKHASPLVRHGWYLTRIAGCEDCHTAIIRGRRERSMMFAGGLPFNGPFGSVFSLNITPDASGIGFMNERMFARTITTGRVNGTGHRLSPVMPFDAYAHLKPYDIHAIYAYLRTVPKVRHDIDNTDPPSYCPLDGEMHGLGDRNVLPKKKQK